MIASRPINFAAARLLGEEIKQAGAAFYLSAPSGAPPDLSFTTDEQSRLKIPIQPGIVYQFPATFSSVWLFHANNHPATDAALVVATGIGELIPSGQPAYAGSAGANKWANATSAGPLNGNFGPVPAAGKRQRILRLYVMIPSNATNAIGGDSNFTMSIFQGGAQKVIASNPVFIPTVAGPTGPPLLQAVYDYGPTGALLDPGTQLQAVILFAFTTGQLNCDMHYTEE